MENSQLMPELFKEALTAFFTNSPIEATFLIGFPPLENVISRAANSLARRDAFSTS
jgi:hypothetical protein